MKPVRISVLGGDGSAAAWLDAIRACEGIEAVAASDRDGRMVTALAEQYGIATFDDPRQMLMQSAADAVIVAVSPAGAEKLLPIAAEQGLAVILDTPPARTVDEAANLLRVFDAGKKPVLVASSWRLDPSLDGVLRFDNGSDRVIQAVAHIEAPWPRPLAWRGDRIRAGGGVLMAEAYDLLDIIVHVMGLPSDVTAQIARLGPSGPEPYDNEDTATVLLRYGDGRAATVAARWGTARYSAGLWLTGEVETKCIMRQEKLDETRRLSVLNTLGARLADNYTPNASSPRTELRNHLPALAVLETCYLSARTTAAESPKLPYERAAASLR